MKFFEANALLFYEVQVILTDCLKQIAMFVKFKPLQDFRSKVVQL